MERIISLDCDGVLADFNAYLLELVGSDRTVDDVDDFKLLRCIERWHGREMRDLAESMLNDPGFTLSQPILPWARELVDECRKLATEVNVVTAPWSSMGWYDARVAWLKRELGFKHEEVAVMRRKHNVFSDLFIDDRTSNVIGWAIKHPNSIAIMPAWSYNDVKDLPKNVIRMQPEKMTTFIKSNGMRW